MSCWSDEDYIGRVARVARKTHGIQLPISTIQKSLFITATSGAEFVPTEMPGC